MRFSYMPAISKLVLPDGSRRYLELAGHRMLTTLYDLRGPFNLEQMVDMAGTRNLAAYAMHGAAARVLIAQVQAAVAGYSLLEETWEDGAASWFFHPDVESLPRTPRDDGERGLYRGLKTGELHEVGGAVR